MKSFLLTVGFLLAMVTPAHAGIGVGAEAMIEGPAGIAVVYDQNRVFRIDGILGVYDAADTEIHLGGRFFYNVHSSAQADLGIGGGLGYIHSDDADLLFLEAGAQIRAFVAGNVALTGTLGLSLVTLDGDGFSLTGQLLGSGGIVYFF